MCVRVFVRQQLPIVWCMAIKRVDNIQLKVLSVQYVNSLLHLRHCCIFFTQNCANEHKNNTTKLEHNPSNRMNLTVITKQNTRTQRNASHARDSVCTTERKKMNVSIICYCLFTMSRLYFRTTHFSEQISL